MSRLVTVQKAVPLHEAVQDALTKNLGREVRCGRRENGEDFGKIFYVEGREETHVGAWSIRNGSIVMFTVEEVEDAEPAVA